MDKVKAHQILRQFINGERNDAGDHWGRSMAAEAFDALSTPQPASADVVALNAEIAILQNNLEAQESCTARIGEHFDILNEKCAALHCLLVDVSRYLDPRQFPEVIGRVDAAIKGDNHAG